MGASDPIGVTIKLVRQLQMGTVLEKCQAADQLGRMGKKAACATSALVEALSDPSEEWVRGYSPVGNGGKALYVRQAAVEALARINPGAAPHLALKVIEELEGKASVRWDNYSAGVSFSLETIKAFLLATQSAGKADTI